MTSDGFVELAPQFLDSIDPGMIDRLKDPMHTRVALKPRIRGVAPVVGRVVADQIDVGEASVPKPHPVCQSAKEVRIMAGAGDGGDGAGIGMQGSGDVDFFVDAGCLDRRLSVSPRQNPPHGDRFA